MGLFLAVSGFGAWGFCLDPVLFLFASQFFLWGLFVSHFLPQAHGFYAGGCLGLILGRIVFHDYQQNWIFPEVLALGSLYWSPSDYQGGLPERFGKNLRINMK